MIKYLLRYLYFFIYLGLKFEISSQSYRLKTKDEEVMWIFHRLKWGMLKRTGDQDRGWLGPREGMQGCHNLEKPGKTWKSDIFWKTQGNSWKLRELFKNWGRLQGNSGNNFSVRKINFMGWMLLQLLFYFHSQWINFMYFLL